MSETAQGSTSSEPPRSAVEAALAAGADEADAWCEESVSLTVRAYEGSVENLTRGGQPRRRGARFVGGRTGYAYGSDLSEEGLRGLAGAAGEAAGVTDPDEHVGLPSVAARRTPPAHLARVGLVDHRAPRRAGARRRTSGARAGPLISQRRGHRLLGRSRARRARQLRRLRGVLRADAGYAYAYAFAGEGRT